MDKVRLLTGNSNKRPELNTLDSTTNNTQTDMFLTDVKRLHSAAPKSVRSYKR